MNIAILIWNNKNIFKFIIRSLTLTLTLTTSDAASE